MTSATDFKTDWEAAQYKADHGRTAAIAIGQQLLGHHITSCGSEDMAILGLSKIPEPRPQMWPVTAGTDEERRARIDTWAARHGITAHYDDASGQYRAVLTFGLTSIIVYAIPEETMAGRVRYAGERLAAMHRAVAEAQS